MLSFDALSQPLKSFSFLLIQFTVLSIQRFQYAAFLDIGIKEIAIKTIAAVDIIAQYLMKFGLLLGDIKKFLSPYFRSTVNTRIMAHFFHMRTNLSEQTTQRLFDEKTKTTLPFAAISLFML